MPRLFIALPMEPEVRDYIQPVNDFLRTCNSALKLVESDNYHITLKFFGDCGNDEEGKILNMFQNIPVPSSKIPFNIKGIGAFPSPDRASVLWAGLETSAQIIDQLQENAEKFAQQIGFEKENKRFVPHLTIARIRKGKKIDADLLNYINNNKSTLYGESSFSKLTLYSSKLTPKGPIYTELKSAVFGKRA